MGKRRCWRARWPSSSETVLLLENTIQFSGVLYLPETQAPGHLTPLLASQAPTLLCVYTGRGRYGRDNRERQKDKEIKNNSFGRWLFLLLVLDILSQAFWSYAKEVHHGQRKLLSSRLLGGKQKEKHLRFQHHLQKHASKDLILFSFGIPLKSLPAVPHVGGDIAFST